MVVRSSWAHPKHSSSPREALAKPSCDYFAIQMMRNVGGRSWRRENLLVSIHGRLSVGKPMLVIQSRVAEKPDHCSLLPHMLVKHVKVLRPMTVIFTVESSR